MSLRRLLSELAEIRRQLARHGIRDESGYAVVLVAAALGGRAHKSGVAKGSDLIAPGYGRVEVRSRTLPLDGRKEMRLNLPPSKLGEFDWFAGVIFHADLSVHVAFLLPHDAAWECASSNKRNDITLKEAQARKEFKPLPRLAQAQAECDV